MIGKRQITFDASDFIKGISTNQHVADRGYSNEEGSANPAAVPGLLYGPADTVDSDTDLRLTDEIIASCPDHQTAGTENREVVTEDGKYYRYNGTKISGVALRTDSNNTYQKGFTDQVVYSENTYTTSKEALTKWNGANTFGKTFTVTIASPAVFTSSGHKLSVDQPIRLETTGALPTGLSTGTTYYVISAGLTADTFQVSTVKGGSAVNTSGSQSGTHSFQWGFTNNTYPHPLLVFENSLYAGDKNLLLRTTDKDTPPTTILTLDSSETIYALGIDKGSGRILIATKNILDVSNTLTAIHKLYWYDGSSNGVDKVVEVEDMITSFQSVGNEVIVGYGLNIGVLRGSGIDFLRKLRNVTADSEKLPYKHNFAIIGETLFIVDGDQILAYGPIQDGGPKIWYYLYLNDITVDQTFKAIFPAGENKLGLSSPIKKFHTLDVMSKATTSNGLDIKTNWYQFSRPVIFRGVWLDMAESVNLANVTLRYKYDDSTGFRGLQVEGGSYTGAFEVPNFVGFVPNKVTSIQFSLAISSQNIGFRKLIAHYDFVE